MVELARLPTSLFEEFKTAENEVVRGELFEVCGPGLLDAVVLRIPEPTAEISEVVSGVRPRRELCCCGGAPQTECCDRKGREADDLSVLEATEDWVEWGGGGKLI